MTEALASVLALVPEAMLLLRTDGRIAGLNSAAERLLGRSRSELEGDLLQNHLCDDPQRVEHWLRDAFATRGPIPGRVGLVGPQGPIECRVQAGAIAPRSEPEPLLLGVCFTPVREETSRFALLNQKIDELSREILRRMHLEAERAQLLTSEREARRSAEQANRLKDEFLATLSHELRTPLNAILGWASMLRSGEMSSEQLEKAVESIYRSAKAQVSMIDDLLDVSRIITGKLRLDLRSVDLKEPVEAALETVQPTAEAKGVRLEWRLGLAPAPVHADPDRLQQVVWNLLSNAIKFTPAGGRVDVRTIRHDTYVELTVSDTGEGIDAEVLPYIFDRFRQGEGRLTRTHQGLGLGLSIVKHLVELHGGSARAASDGLGRGTTFTITLPRFVRPSPASEPPTHFGLDASSARMPSGSADPLDTGSYQV